MNLTDEAPLDCVAYIHEYGHLAYKELLGVQKQLLTELNHLTDIGWKSRTQQEEDRSTELFYRLMALTALSLQKSSQSARPPSVACPETPLDDV